MLCFCLSVSLGCCIFISENQGYNGERTATYNRLKTGAAETGDRLTLSHKLQRSYAK